MKNKEIPILMYHQFLQKKDSSTTLETFVTASQFKIQLWILKILGYETITFKELDKIGLENRFKKKYIILTVDDGYENNFKVMFPILKQFNMKVVIYIVSDLNFNKWDVDKYNEKKINLLNQEQITEMIKSGLVEFGGHTASHCNLNEISLEKAREEILNNKIDLENKYNLNLISFAYPYGILNEKVKKIVKEAGYKFAVSTDTGSGIITDDLFEIRRSAIDKTSIFNFLRKISFKYSVYKAKKTKR